MNDSKIIGLYFARSESAIAETDKKYGGCCRSTAYGILGSREDSEECVNDTYLKVWNSIPPERPARLGAFVLRIVRNLALDLRRRRNTLKGGSGFGAVGFDEVADFLPAPGSVEGEADRKAVLAAIEAFLLTLPKEKRVMFVRRYFYCSSYKEIADALLTTEDRVAVTLHRVREKLRGYLEKEGIGI
ncbi:MAG: sigma-70 family RNA polymerase sigma factor [Ruminiclostridium sp.]|nr:sigma-70 family RNA polymerase sigma factor [Ruminiclostridium sp.]